MFKIVIMFKSLVNVCTPRHKNICIFAIKYIIDYHTIGLFAIFCVILNLGVAISTSTPHNTLIGVF